jgi:hypothetical protein
MGLYYTKYSPLFPLFFLSRYILILLLFPRVQIQTVYHLLRPNAIEGRLPSRRRERVNYISPGPNDVWHINGHMKLEPFGIEIYTTIDGYSRYIV